MKTTVEYFNMSLDDLVTIGNEEGYTREECKLFDEGWKVHFCEDMKEYEAENDNVIKWYKSSQGLDLVNTLVTVNGRIAMIFD